MLANHPTLRPMDRLDQLTIPKPCHEDWETMDGDTQRRHCEACACTVVHLSSMTREAAIDTLGSARADKRRLCVRVQRDARGRVVTQTERYQALLGVLQRHAAAQGAAVAPRRGESPRSTEETPQEPEPHA